jgi:hypothetical protein
MSCSVIGMISMYEGFNLILHGDPSFYGIGPGLYLLIISIILMGGTIVYLVVNWRKFHSEEKVVTSREMRLRLMSTIGNCAMYIMFISILGYFVSTLIFFFLQFRIQGIKSWFSTFMLTFIISITYYLVFVRYCSLIFPRGILFKIGFGL